MKPEPSEAIRKLILEGNLDEAEQLAYEGLKQAPAYPPLWIALGDIEEIRGQKDSASRLREAAIQSLRSIADKGGSSLFSDALEGWVLWKEERMEEAIEPLQRCAMAMKGGDDAFVQLLLGSAYLLNQRYREARFALERAHTGALRPGLQDQAMEGLKVIAATRANVLGICESQGVSLETLLASGEIPESDTESIRELCEAGDLSQLPSTTSAVTAPGAPAFSMRNFHAAPVLPDSLETGGLNGTKARRKLRLADGREIWLVRMYREEFYIGLLEGTPDPWDNDMYFHRFRAEARERFGWLGKQGSTVLPFKVRHLPSQDWVPLQRKIGPEGQDGYLGDPEQFPTIVSAGLFESDPTKGDTDLNEGSALTVIWFQHDALVVLEEEPLAWLRLIKWDELAYDFTN